MSDFTEISYHERIAVITLNSPPHNYLKRPSFIDAEVLESILNSKEICGVIIRGAGRNFSAGAAVLEIFEMSSQEILHIEVQKGKQILNLISESEIPVMAAVSGVCFGAGLEIALACHTRISAANTLFAFPESGLNLMPGLSGHYNLLHKTTAFFSLDMILGGDTADAALALKYGLIDEICEGDVLAAAMKRMKRWTDNKPRKLISSVMKALHAAQTLPKSQALETETKLFCELAKDEFELRKAAI